MPLFGKNHREERISHERKAAACIRDIRSGGVSMVIFS